MLSLKEAALKYAGNWMKWKGHVWYNKPEDFDLIGWYLLSHRDTEDDPLTQSNQEYFEKEFKNSENAWTERHFHDLVGYTNWLMIRVMEKVYIRTINKDPEFDLDLDTSRTLVCIEDRWYRLTEEFEKFCDILCHLEDYPILNEDRWGELECDQERERIQDIIKHPSWYRDLRASPEMSKIQVETVESFYEDSTQEEIDDLVSTFLYASNGSEITLEQVFDEILEVGVTPEDRERIKIEKHNQEIHNKYQLRIPVSEL